MSVVDTSVVDSVIRFDGVSKYFGRPGSADAFCAVDKINLQIEPGQLVAILGKTGCGKSTLFNMIAGLSQPSEGSVLVAGRNPFADFEWFRGRIAIVFQSDRLLPWRTAVQNVELGLELLRAPKQERRNTALRWLETLGLQGHENDYPHALSGGMRQRVSIARAFATSADIHLYDEPFSALDEITAGRLRKEFARLVRENRKTAIFVTHSINEALEIGDRIITLRKPAQIALDAKLPPDADDETRRRLRAQIEAVLAE